MRNYRLLVSLDGPHSGRAPLEMSSRLRAGRVGAVAPHREEPAPSQVRPALASGRRRLMLVVLVVLSIVGCVALSSRALEDMPLGAQESFYAATPRKVLVLPITGAASFGVEPEAREAVLTQAEARFVEAVRARGFEVVEAPSALAAARAPNGEAWEPSALRRELWRWMEDRGEGHEETQRAVSSLAWSVGADAVLLGRVLYQSDATCEPSTSSPYTSHVALVGGAPQGAEPVPCAVSHVEARLVGANDGRLLWANRVLRELRAPHAGAATPDMDENLRAAVALTVGEGELGLPSAAR